MSRHAVPKRPGRLARRGMRQQLRVSLDLTVRSILDGSSRSPGSPALNDVVRNRSLAAQMNVELSLLPEVAALRPGEHSAICMTDADWYKLIGESVAHVHRLVLSVRCYEMV